MKDKVSLGVDKRDWRPSPLPGQIVLVTTVNPDGTTNVAPKSWIAMIAFDPPLLALGCNLAHWTAVNILAQREFVVNMPSADLIEMVWRSAALPHPRPVEALGLTARPAMRVRPPCIEECVAHLECVLDTHLTYGAEVILLGRIVAATIDQAAGQTGDPYAYLRPPFFLENGVYGVIERGHRVGDRREA
jgi:flavin reductase (DIM6/NTAB) family NADH-FMN oxidoreductase RutF